MHRWAGAKKGPGGVQAAQLMGEGAGWVHSPEDQERSGTVKGCPVALAEAGGGRRISWPSLGGLQAVSLPPCSILCLHTQPSSNPTLVFHDLYFFLHIYFFPQLDGSLLGSRRPPSFLESPTESGTALYPLRGLGNTG